MSFNIPNEHLHVTVTRLTLRGAFVSIFFAATLGAQQLRGQDLRAQVGADTGTAAEGLRDGSADASERSVAGRMMLGFLGGLPVGFFAPSAVAFNPGSIVGVGLGLGVIGATWKLGDAKPRPQSSRGRGESYNLAYSEIYRERLLERRKQAGILGGLVGGVSGLGLLVLLLSQLP